MITLLLTLLHQDPTPDLKKYLIIQEGTVPVIISAPHGGTVVVAGVDPRKGEGVSQFTTVRDINTDLLAQKLAEKLEMQLGGKPWLVVAKFSRKYIDAIGLPVVRTKPKKPSRSMMPTTEHSKRLAKR